ncbi:META domain-containing protein [Novosphingobium album (ex Liu et al. 2023)]|uniref:META domain-containing protein n=1 Tax=Novosphingobium album (ex Liu et al. 2023) TaxID=3031130 RepID=A0ABT5WPZ2_9SPHN|nr:META domain-containing protein [Novosphingobium album (ex Liu et al. 2023)]MDE8651944.1 META domain-containing protein [Novosphingobium album (ex Liu et al. 2023)]
MKQGCVALLSVMALGACTAQHEATDLADSTWRFTEIDGARPAARDAQLVFDGALLGANVGCNGMGGPWRIENDRLIAGPLEKGATFCDGRVWGQEKAVGALLVAAPRFAIRGDTMVLKSNGHTAELRRKGGPGEG